MTADKDTHNFAEITDLLLRDNIELYSVNTDTDPIDRKLGVLGALARATGGLPTVRIIEVKGRNPKWDFKHRKGYSQIR